MAADGAGLTSSMELRPGRNGQLEGATAARMQAEDALQEAAPHVSWAPCQRLRPTPWHVSWQQRRGTFRAE